MINTMLIYKAFLKPFVFRNRSIRLVNFPIIPTNLLNLNNLESRAIRKTLANRKNEKIELNGIIAIRSNIFRKKKIFLFSAW